jgi:glutaredoxin
MNIIIYGRPNCVHCERAKRMLDIKKIPYTYDDLTTMKGVDARNVVHWSGMKSVPIVYVDNICIGGADALEGYIRGKELGV